MFIEDDIFSIVDCYDTLFVDMYGVLFDGDGLLEGTLETLERLKDRLGKKIIILSNSTQTSDEACKSYEKYGMLPNVHYDLFITSGELLKYELNNNFSGFPGMLPSKVNTIASLFQWSNSVFLDTNLTKVDSYDDADLIYIGVPKVAGSRIDISSFYDEGGRTLSPADVIYTDWKTITDAEGERPLRVLAELLDDFLRKRKMLLVANPDIFAPGTLDGSKKKRFH
jgi:hypothetical protein